MENRNDKTKNFFKGIIFGAVVVALLAATVGCGKKKGNNNVNPYGYNRYGYGGPGYGGNGTINGVSAGISNDGQFMLILATSGQAGYGSGPVFVEGELHVFNPMGCVGNPQLGLAPGVYQIIPYNGAQAMLDIDFLTNVVVVAQGPSVSAILTIPYVKIFQSQVCGLDGMMGLMNVETINGWSCGLSAGFSDTTPAPGMCGY